MILLVTAFILSLINEHFHWPDLHNVKLKMTCNNELEKMRKEAIKVC